MWRKVAGGGVKDAPGQDGGVGGDSGHEAVEPLPGVVVVAHQVVQVGNVVAHLCGV